MVSAIQVRGIAPQFLVNDLNNAVECYRDILGFSIDFVYDSFYSSVSRDGCSIHLKCAPKTVSDRVHRTENEHLDAHIDVLNVDALYKELVERGADITKKLAEQAWQCRDFQVKDCDGYILCFSEVIT